MDAQTTVARRKKVPVCGGGEIEIALCHGPDWFPLAIYAAGRGSGPSMHCYLRRAHLRQLRDLLNEIDERLPEPEATL